MFFGLFEVPVIVLFDCDFVGNFDQWVILVEFFLVFFRVEFRFDWWLFLLNTLFLTLRSILIISLALLFSDPDIISLEISSMLGNKGLLRLLDSLCPLFRALSGLFFAFGPVFGGLFAVRFSVNDVGFSGLNGESQPLKEFSKGQIMLRHSFFLQTTDDFLTVVEFLVHFELVTFGTEHLIFVHFTGDFFLDQTLGIFPPEKLRTGLAYLFLFESKQVHKTLEDLGHLKDPHVIQLGKLSLPIVILRK
jgi:hypothetical protein